MIWAPGARVVLLEDTEQVPWQDDAERWIAFSAGRTGVIVTMGEEEGDLVFKPTQYAVVQFDGDGEDRQVAIAVDKLRLVGQA